jgi:single-strand DNA-binding protein
VASYNRVVLMGNLTRDIEVKYIQSGTAVANASLAVNEKRKDNNGQWVDDVTFVDLTLWGRTAEVAGEYLSKGSPVLVEGRLKQEQWEKDGQKRSKMIVVVEKLQMIGSKKDGGQRSSGGGGDDYSQAAPSEPSQPPPAGYTQPPAAQDDPIPF